MTTALLQKPIEEQSPAGVSAIEAEGKFVEAGIQMRCGD
jgi:hypothetical protein